MPSSDRWCGFNFGNWLSQSSLKPPHIDKFYKEDDVALLSDWGFNFVRLPVDYMFFENDESPGVYDEKRLSYVDRAISWCSKYNVHVNLDMHELPGYGISRVAGDRSFKPTLWTQEDLLRRSEDVWRMFAKRYVSEGDILSFNLINEPIAEMSLYQRFIKRMIAAIREVDRERLIIIDGCDVARTPVPNIADERVAQSFHMYEPGWFTHYGAFWAPGGYLYEAGCYIYEEPARYPGVPPRMERYLDRLPPERYFDRLPPRRRALMKNLHDFFSRYAGVRIDRSWLENRMEPWLRFREETSTLIHCGEMGVYALRVDRESQLNWYRDVLDMFKQHNIGWALWNLRGSFGIINHGREEFPTERLQSGDLLDSELLHILQNSL